MIFKILDDLVNYLENEIPDRTFQLNYLPGRDVISQSTSDSIYITLLSISEDVSSKIPYVYKQDVDLKLTKQNAPIFLDLCILISSFFTQYTEGLKAISEVIQKISDKNRFKTNELEYNITLYNISMEQNSNLWQALSTNVLPNVIYKVRCVHIIPAADSDREATAEVNSVNIKTSGK